MEYALLLYADNSARTAPGMLCYKEVDALTPREMSERGNVQFLAHFDSGIASR